MNIETFSEYLRSIGIQHGTHDLIEEEDDNDK